MTQDEIINAVATFLDINGKQGGPDWQDRNYKADVFKPFKAGRQSQVNLDDETLLEMLKLRCPDFASVEKVAREICAAWREWKYAADNLI